MASQVTGPGQDSGIAPEENIDKQPVVCVFCGASPGTSPAHLEAARDLAYAFHRHGIKLVYGGGSTGVMGEVAKTLVSLSGKNSVHGIIPRALLEYERKEPQDGKDAQNSQLGLNPVIDENIYGRTTVVQDMHTRKLAMAEEVIRGAPGGGFVALSGGYGTLEELMEVVTWNQLGIHERGIVLYNVNGYWDGLLQWVKSSVAQGFVTKTNESIMVEANTAEAAVESLKNYQNSKGRFRLHWDQK